MMAAAPEAEEDQSGCDSSGGGMAEAAPLHGGGAEAAAGDVRALPADAAPASELCASLRGALNALSAAVCSGGLDVPHCKHSLLGGGLAADRRRRSDRLLLLHGLLGRTARVPELVVCFQLLRDVVCDPGPAPAAAEPPRRRVLPAGELVRALPLEPGDRLAGDGPLPWRRHTQGGPGRGHHDLRRRRVLLAAREPGALELRPLRLAAPPGLQIRRREPDPGVPAEAVDGAPGGHGGAAVSSADSSLKATPRRVVAFGPSSGSSSAKPSSSAQGP
eukprot:CAMPEP_0195149968 /NCGR_PEP_ID=MMETSP0448-20130528/178018_1 /TAXON_ID=66468 /ORGANISM="Heterocapsa triquestra, Strain CCMP 448" /LENGTH=274 /DNA_ID=CAMNT_0040188635 /DNA_START=24 /DNA_END=845 /DNA_ORIENTATION=+